eukprot:4810189-Amphidinium_carterae.1
MLPRVVASVGVVLLALNRAFYSTSLSGEENRTVMFVGYKSNFRHFDKDLWDLLRNLKDWNESLTISHFEGLQRLVLAQIIFTTLPRHSN